MTRKLIIALVSLVALIVSYRIVDSYERRSIGHTLAHSRQWMAESDVEMAQLQAQHQAFLAQAGCANDAEFLAQLEQQIQHLNTGLSAEEARAEASWAGGGIDVAE